jgi:ATP-binding cassette, subfamily C, bacterial LapB
MPELGKNDSDEQLHDGTAVADLESETDAPQFSESLGDELFPSLQLLLNLNGSRKSKSAIKSAITHSYDVFGLKEAIVVCREFGFEPNFKSISANKIIGQRLPALILLKDGKVVIIEKVPEDKSPILVRVGRRKSQTKLLSWEKFVETFSGIYLSIRKMSSDEQKEARGHWFLGAFSRSKWLYIQVALAAIVSNFLALTTSIFTMTVYDRVIPNNAVDSLIALSIGVILALCFDFIIKTLRARFIDIASQKADLIVSNTIFNRILSLTANEQKQRTGALASIVKEFESLREFFTSSTLVILIDLPFVFFFIYVIYLIAGPLAYVPLTAVPLVIFVGLLIQPFMARLTKKSMSTGMNKQAVLVETLSGLESVNSVGAGALMKRRYMSALVSQSDSGVKSRKISQFMVNFSAAVQQYAQVGAIIYGVFLIKDGLITQGALIAAVILGGRTLAPLGQLANAMTRVNGALQAFKSLKALMGQFNFSSSPTYISRPELEGNIEFRNVDFEFEGADRAIIENLSLKIPKGQKVAVVGKMGSGKSTFAKLLGGIYSPTKGSVLIDGIDVRQIDRSDLVDNLGIMLQDTWLFSGTVRDNILAGSTGYTEEEFLQAAKLSGTDDFIGKNPMGYDLELKEKGVGVSGGQRQSIALARVLIKEPSIFLLDEPTSAMDQASEHVVISNIIETSQDKTLIMVTHRNSLLSFADRVLVFDNGKIISDSTPEQLGVKRP